MANTFYREPVEGADENSWAPLLLSIIAESIGAYNSYLYDDSGALKLTRGKIGIDDNTNRGVVVLDTEETIDLSSVSSGNWAKIEMSVSGIIPSFSASDISGATDPETIPVDFSSAYNNEKNGFYIIPTSRTIGVVWVNSSAVLKGIVNCADKVNGYIGENVTDDVNEYPIYFEKNILRKDNVKFNNVQKFGIFTDSVTYAGGTPAQWIDVPFSDTEFNNIPGLSLSSNTFTLSSGKYKISAEIGYTAEYPAAGYVAASALRLWDNDNSVVKIKGVWREISSSLEEKDSFILNGIIEIDLETDFKLQIYSFYNITLLGDPPGTSIDDSVYGRKVIFERLA